MYLLVFSGKLKEKKHQSNIINIKTEFKIKTVKKEDKRKKTFKRESRKNVDETQNSSKEAGIFLKHHLFTYLCYASTNTTKHQFFKKNSQNS